MSWPVPDKVDVEKAERVVLYDSKHRPLVRPVGFRGK